MGRGKIYGYLTGLVLVLLLIVTFPDTETKIQIDAGREVSYKTKELHINAEFYDKEYDGTVEAKLKKFKIAEADLLEGDILQIEDIEKDISLTGSFYRKSGSDLNHLEVNLQASASFEKNSKWAERYHLSVLETEAKILPKDLQVTEINIKDKIYDGSAMAQAEQFVIDKSAIAQTDHSDCLIKYIQIYAEYEDYNVGYQKVQVSAQFMGKNKELYAARYRLKWDDYKEQRANITPKPVHLKISDNYTVTYSEYHPSQLDKQISIYPDALDVIEGDDISDLLLPKAALMEKVPCYLGQPCVSPEGGRSVLGIDTEGYQFCEENNWYEHLFEGKNYKFVFINTDRKKFIVEREKVGNSRDFIQIAREINYIYQDPEKQDLFWTEASGKEKLLKIAPTVNKDGGFYTDVILETTGKNLTKDGIYVKEINDEPLRIFLTAQPDNGLELEKEVINSSEVFNITIKIDEEAPQITIQMGMHNAPAEKAPGKVTFSVFEKEIVDAVLTADDRGESGIVSIFYAVLKIKDGQEYIDQDQIGNCVIWYPVSLKDYTEGSPILIKNYEEPFMTLEKECNYILAVKAEDLVGNSKIYVSDGIVLDRTKPSAEVKFYSEKAAEGIYHGNVEAVVTLNDPVMDYPDAGKVISGVKILRYILWINGKKEEEETEQLPDGKEMSWNELKDSYYQYKKVICISGKKYNSNNIKLELTAYDQAGNERTITKEIKIDITLPEVSIKYKSKADSQNTIYFNKDRIAEVTVKERNFDPSQVKFYLKKVNAPAGIYNLEQLNKELGIQASWIDSQNNIKNKKFYTDQRTNTARIIFNKDNDYTFEAAVCVDLAGNRFKKIKYEKDGDKANKHFVIDKTPPILIISYDSDGKKIQPGRTEAKRIYKSKAITAHIGIREKNFVLEGRKLNINILLRDKNHNKKIPDWFHEIKKPETWNLSGSLRTAELHFKKDLNYIFGMEYTDLAGNKAVYQYTYFTVDKTHPVGKITMNELGIWREFKSKIKYEVFDNQAQKISILGSDKTSGIKSISYIQSANELKKNELNKIKQWKKGSEFIVLPQKKLFIYARIIDQAGNLTYINSGVIILDTQKPSVDIKLETPEPLHGIFSKNVLAKIAVIDPIYENVYSGLKSVSYEVLSGREVTQSGNFSFSLLPVSRGIKLMSENIKIDAQKNNSNSVTIRVIAEDMAGNKRIKEKKLKIDVTKPQISISYLDGTPEEGKYCSTDRTALITVKEQNFDPEQVKISIKNDKRNKTITGIWSSPSAVENSLNGIHTCIVSFKEEGDYTVTLSCKDLAGNNAEYEIKDNFTIDKTKPQISVTYDNVNVTGDRYYNKKRTAFINIKEHNFDEKNIKIKVLASLEGRDIIEPVISGFKTNGDVHTASVTFQYDGDYTFSIECWDKAGNRASPNKIKSFTIDTEPPVIKVKNIKKANRETAAPIIEYTDINGAPDSLKITLEGEKHKKYELHGIPEDIPNGIRIRLEDILHKQEADDIYILKVRARDKAGNIEKTAYIFSVNRFGSVYNIDRKTQKLLNLYYVNKPEDLIITETNTDTLKFKEITCSRDGNLITLKEGKDYTVQESGEFLEWKAYQYIIDKKNFMKDGRYRITIYSEDNAKNTSSNQARGKLIEFVVDNKKPSMVITGIEDGGRYREDSHEIHVDAKDNISLEKLVIEVELDKEKNSRKYEFLRDELKDSFGEITVDLQSSNTWQTVKISATDRAGNTVNSDNIRVLITSSLWIQFYRNKLLFVSVIAITAALIGFLFWIINKKIIYFKSLLR